MSLAPILEGIVIGHWSQDGKQRVINGAHGNVFPYSSGAELKKAIVSFFSFDCQTIIDADTANGNSQICAFICDMRCKVGHSQYIV